jgi:hypothetical protein
VLYRILFHDYLEGICPLELEETINKIERNSDLIGCMLNAHRSLGYNIRSGYDAYGYESLWQMGMELRYLSDRMVDPKKLDWMLNAPKEYRKLKEIESRTQPNE